MNFKPQISVLKNGLRVLKVCLPPLSSVTALVLVKTGSRWETSSQAGISHFLEHMVFKGTQKYPTALALTSKVDSVGAEFNAFTSKEITGFYVKCAANHLNLALDILSQMIFEPLLKPEEIEKEKGVIIEEINMREDTPMLKIEEEFESLLYGNTSLGRETIGFKNTIKKISQKDFLTYRQKWYLPSKMVLAIAGGVWRQQNLIKLAEKYFGKDTDLKTSTKTSPLKFKQEKPGLKIKFKKTEQAHLCLGVRAFPRSHPNRYLMAVLTTILGGNMSSRLFTEIREKRGLAYYIKSNINTYFDNGYLVVQAGVDTAKIFEAIRVILNEFGKLTQKLVSDEELKRAKEYLKGKLALSLEDSYEIASFFGEDLILEDKIRLLEDIIRGIEKVSKNDIKKVAQKIFANKNLNLAVIGPYKEEEKFCQILKI